MLLSFRSVSGGFSLVDCIPSILVFRCPIVMLINFPNILIYELLCEAWPSLQENLFGCLEEDCCFWDETCCMKILCQFWFSFLVQNVICHNFLLLYLLFTSHIPVCLFLANFIIYCPFFWTDIYCLSSFMVHPSSHQPPNDLSEAVFIFGEI